MLLVSNEKTWTLYVNEEEMEISNGKLLIFIHSFTNLIHIY